MKRKLFKLLLVLQCQLLLVLLAPVVSAQIRLHDATNDELAKRTREAFAEFSRGDANVFETMVGNTLTLKEATLLQLYELNREGTRATVNLIPLWTWKELRETHVRNTQSDFLDAYLAARQILKLRAVEIRNLKDALNLAQTDLKEAKDERAKKEEELTRTEQPKLAELIASIEKLKNGLAASSKPINRLSDLDTEFNNLKTVWASISSLKVWWDAAERSTNAPGLQLTILDLGVAHQQKHVDRLKLDLEQANAAQKRLERMEERLKLVWGTGEQLDETREATGGLFGQVYKGIANVPDDNEQVLQTIGRMAKLAESEVGTRLTVTTQLRNLLDVLGRYVSLDGYQKYLLFSDAIEAGVDEHLFSIRRSALNTKEREVLVGYGLDGLAAYHAGGIKPEDIANFFRAAQTIALGIMAGRD
jgi:tetrahydromethanopterin S-methyltransferase subunit G